MSIEEGKTIVGKQLLIGLTYLDVHGEVKERRQVHGKITSTSNGTLVVENADGSGSFSIPFEGDFELKLPTNYPQRTRKCQESICYLAG